MKLSEWSNPTLVQRLAAEGLFLSTGPFVYHITSDIAAIADGLHQLYGDFPAVDAADFADFHVDVPRRRNWRRWDWDVDVRVGGEAPAIALPIEQAYAVFEGCLNWCIYTQAHQYLIVHAATVEKDGHAVVLPAAPGSGKSTLCAALMSRGWRLLTDELTIVDVDTRMILPLVRPVSLKNQSIQVIAQFAPQSVFGPVSPNTIKGTIAHVRPPIESVARAGECCRARWLVTPQYSAGSTTKVTPLSKGRAFMLMAASSVNYLLHGGRGFSVLTDMIDGADAFRLVYSDLDDAIRWFDQLNAG